MQTTDIDFVIVGAAKCATTWLQRALQSDPQVAMPDPELHYFSRHFERGLDWYLDQFPSGAADRLTGEKSNSYLDTPQAPARVHAALPHARLIVQLRNPIERAYSDYCMLYRRGEVGSDITRYLDPDSATKRRFLDDGLYYRQLEPYLERYPRERLLILLYDDMLRTPQAHLDHVRSFLGLAPRALPAASRKKVKDRTEPMLSPSLRRLMQPIRPAIEPFRKTPLFRAVRRQVVREIAYPTFPLALRNRLAGYYRPDIAKLEALIGRDLAHWADPAEADTPFGLMADQSRKTAHQYS
ncbi:sulfotransferase domain-containing protein [Jiella sp. MQZ9-1]|uniref:Sulfotransferase n=1 Tax=Jiella flava TaxID=2816857 RepID=A0A939FX02_9HYPH|nr:sulfotransferase [Jiella flava]MBO0663045.1 sulfotransferase [Jiella flava]MCD2471464.1 sulfotransferase domain-containing protein [Jiella flava]